jgi:hypothetical protein
VTERFREPAARNQGDAAQRPAPGQRDAVAIALDGRLTGRLAELADGRVLVIDDLVTSTSWSMPEGELSARLQRQGQADFVRIAAPEAVPCMAEPRLMPILRDAGLTLRPVAGAVLGQFELELSRPWAWLDLLATAARRP